MGLSGQTGWISGVEQFVAFLLHFRYISRDILPA